MSFAVAGRKETKNQRGKDLRLIQIRLATPSVEKLGPARQAKTEREQEVEVRVRQIP
jgi:hypothetical protein